MTGRAARRCRTSWTGSTASSTICPTASTRRSATRSSGASARLSRRQSRACFRPPWPAPSWRASWPLPRQRHSPLQHVAEEAAALDNVLERASAGLSRVGGVLVPDAPGRRPLCLAAGVGVLAAAGVGVWLAAPYLAVAAGWLGGRVA